MSDVFSTHLESGAGSFGPLTAAILNTYNTEQQAVQMYGPAPQSVQETWRALINGFNQLEQDVLALQQG